VSDVVVKQFTFAISSLDELLDHVDIACKLTQTRLTFVKKSLLTYLLTYKNAGVETARHESAEKLKPHLLQLKAFLRCLLLS